MLQVESFSKNLKNLTVIFKLQSERQMANFGGSANLPSLLGQNTSRPLAAIPQTPKMLSLPPAAHRCSVAVYPVPLIPPAPATPVGLKASDVPLSSDKTPLRNPLGLSVLRWQQETEVPSYTNLSILCKDGVVSVDRYLYRRESFVLANYLSDNQTREYELKKYSVASIALVNKILENFGSIDIMSKLKIDEKLMEELLKFQKEFQVRKLLFVLKHHLIYLAVLSQKSFGFDEEYELDSRDYLLTTVYRILQKEELSFTFTDPTIYRDLGRLIFSINTSNDQELKSLRAAQINFTSNFVKTKIDFGSCAFDLSNVPRILVMLLLTHCDKKNAYLSKLTLEGTVNSDRRFLEDLEGRAAEAAKNMIQEHEKKLALDAKRRPSNELSSAALFENNAVKKAKTNDK